MRNNYRAPLLEFLKQLNVAVFNASIGFFQDRSGSRVLTFVRSRPEFITLVVILLPLNCLGQFDLRGTINIKEGTIFLRQFSLDTSFPAKHYESKIDQGKFSFQGQLDEVNGYYFEFDNEEGLIIRSDLFLLDTGVQHAWIDIKFPQMPLIENKLMEIYNNHTYFKQRKVLLKNILWLDSLQNSVVFAPEFLQDSLTNTYKLIRKNYLERDKELGDNLHSYFNHSHISLLNIYQKYLNSYDVNSLLAFFDMLSDEIQSTTQAQNLYTLLVRQDQTSVGKVFPSISLYNLKDDTLRNIDFHKKYTLLDFWWSGCGHCIKEFPTYLELYQGELNSIFDVVQISVDKTSALRQLNRIRERFNFPWRELLDENGKTTEFLKLYSFPSNFLVDSQGVIIKKNIRPSDLEQFLLISK